MGLKRYKFFELFYAQCTFVGFHNSRLYILLFVQLFSIVSGRRNLTEVFCLYPFLQFQNPFQWQFYAFSNYFRSHSLL